MCKRLVVILALAFAGGVNGFLADTAASPSGTSIRSEPFAGGVDFFPPEVPTYSSGAAAREAAGAKPEEPVFGGTLARAPHGPSSDLRWGGRDSSSRRRYLPVLFSLLVPGAGEIYMGYYVRGAVLLAAEVTAWSGYVHYHGEGLESLAEYERFADDHWSYDRWIDHHPLWDDPEYQGEDPTFETLDRIGQDRDKWDKWPPYHTWASKEEEKHNYYENIGKYDWFISGWQDWDPATQPRETDMRKTYRAMRKKSNDELDRATTFIYLSVAARFVSLVQTLILTRGDRSEAGGESPSSGFSIEAGATGLASGEVALVYRFR